MSKNSYKVMAVDFAALLVWLICVLVFTDFSTVGFYYKCGIACTVVAVIIAVVSIVLIQPESNINTMEINAIPLFGSQAYVFITMIVNTIFVIIKDANNNKIPVAVNLILLIIFIGSRIFTNSYGEQVDSLATEVAQKIEPVKNVKAKMSELLAVSSDADIKKAVLKLKELVDFSGNMSSDNTYDIEMNFYDSVNDIIGKIKDNADKDEILKDIEDAVVMWKTRNITHASR